MISNTEKVILGVIAILTLTITATFYRNTTKTPEDLRQTAEKVFSKEEGELSNMDYRLAEQYKEAIHKERKVLQATKEEQLIYDRQKTSQEFFWEPTDELVGEVEILIDPFPANMVKENPWVLTSVAIPSDSGNNINFVRVMPTEEVSKGQWSNLYKKKEGEFHYYYLLPQKRSNQIAQK